MSGGGKIIEKTPTKTEGGKAVVRYRVMSEYRPGWYDESFVYAEPADQEPQVGDSIMWGAEPAIYFGSGETKRLTKVGYSTRA